MGGPLGGPLPARGGAAGALPALIADTYYYGADLDSSTYLEGTAPSAIIGYLF